jgi:hypothetical protein
MKVQGSKTPVCTKESLKSPRNALKRNERLPVRLEEILATELLSVCLAALRPYGVDPQKALRSQLSREASVAQTPVARRLFQDADRLGDLANEWTENPQFIDQSGRPLVLPIRGRGPTFETLIRRYFGPKRLRDILELAIQTRVVERVGRDRVAHVNSCVMLTGHRVLLLARAVLSVQWMLAGAENNGLPLKEQSDLLPERMACAYISKERVTEFSSLMLPHLFNVVDMANRWLSEHMVRDRSKEAQDHTRLVGVHAYVFRE